MNSPVIMQEGVVQHDCNPTIKDTIPARQGDVVMVLGVVLGAVLDDTKKDWLKCSLGGASHWYCQLLLPQFILR